MKLTEHFDIEKDRLWCQCQRHAGEERGIHAFNVHFLGLAQELRYRLNLPINVVSCMRCEDRHKEVCKSAGQPVTQGSGHLWLPHRQVCAFDIHVEGLENLEVAQLAMAVGFTGIGIGKTKLHLDTLPRRALWLYGKNGAIHYALQ